MLLRRYRLSPPVWFLLVGILVNQIGWYMVGPYQAVVLVKHLGLSATRQGW